jgi:hypothetical protein
VAAWLLPRPDLGGKKKGKAHHLSAHYDHTSASTMQAAQIFNGSGRQRLRHQRPAGDCRGDRLGPSHGASLSLCGSHEGEGLVRQ